MALGLSLLAFSCGDDGDGSSDTTAAAIQTYNEIVHASYQDSLTEIQRMNTALQALVDGASADTLQAAKDVWLEAREPYLQTEVYRFYDGPIDGMDGDPEGLINAWPMDEQTVDYVDGDATAGRVNDTGFTISADSISGANGEGGDADVAAGWHPIEFLLWGQDLTEPSMRMPGQRTFEDFSTADNADRRGQYLTTAGDLLESNLSDLVDAWAPGQSNYRQDMETVDEDVALQRILTGMIVLSGFETAGERLQAALDAGNQEEEHSCFSDNTHNDMLFDVIGVQNIYLGRYTRIDGSVVSGTSIEDVVRELDPTLADNLRTRIQTSVDLARALQPPFDLEISPGNTEGNGRVQALIDSLREQEMLLSEVFFALGFTVPNPE
ncbi:MAG: imelysin family protein [Myxococcota bacterium]